MELGSSVPRTLEPQSLVSFQPAVSPCHISQRPRSEEKTTIAASIREIDTNTYPSPSQHAAIVTLLDVNDAKIVAFIALLPSLKSGYEHVSCPNSLSTQQLEAITTLKDCPIDLISAWLRTARYASNDRSLRTRSNGPSRTQRAAGSYRPREQSQGSSSSTFRSSTSALGPSSPFDEYTSHNAPRNSQIQEHSFLDLSRPNSIDDAASHSSSIPSHAHWCTNISCKKRQELRTCDGYKRHEKEHEEFYICMPNGPEDITEAGRECALCGLLDPNSEHFNQQHSVSICLGKLTGPLTKSRKADMIKHLTQHGINRDHGSALAEKWRYKSRKRFSSCGFCIKLFYTIVDRLNHIDVEHYQQGQIYKDWDLNKVIEGLLLQPVVQQILVKYLASYPSVSMPRVSWDPSVAADLQRRLESSEEPADVLTSDAFTLYLSFRGLNRLVTDADSASQTGAIGNTSLAEEHLPDLPYSTNLDQYLDFSIVMPNSIFAPEQSPYLPRDDADNSSFGTRDTRSTLSYHSSTGSEGFPINSHQQGFPGSHHDDTMQSRQLSSDNSPMRSVSSQTFGSNLSFTNSTNPFAQMRPPVPRYPSSQWQAGQISCLNSLPITSVGPSAYPSQDSSYSQNVTRALDPIFPTYTSPHNQISGRGKLPDLMAQMKRKLSRPNLKDKENEPKKLMQSISTQSNSPSR